MCKLPIARLFSKAVMRRLAGDSRWNRKGWMECGRRFVLFFSIPLKQDDVTTVGFLGPRQREMCNERNQQCMLRVGISLMDGLMASTYDADELCEGEEVCRKAGEQAVQRPPSNQSQAPSRNYHTFQGRDPSL